MYVNEVSLAANLKGLNLKGQKMVMNAFPAMSGYISMHAFPGMSGLRQRLNRKMGHEA